MEVWKPVPNYEGLYEVSNLGRVRSLDHFVSSGIKHNKKVIKKGKLLNPSFCRGYKKITLSKDNKRVSKQVHRLVAQAFLLNKDNLPQVNHKDGNKLNNTVDNLEWCTCKENILHAFKNNLRTKEGIRKSVKAMNKKNMKNIIQLSKEGTFLNEFMSLREAQKNTGINEKNISACLVGRTKTAGNYIWRYK